MPAPVTSTQMVRSLLQSLQRNDRQAIVLQLVEIGVWVGVTADPLPPPDVDVISSAALEIALSELRLVIQQHRDMSARIQDRDRSRIAAIIERNTEMLESVAKALAALTVTTGFLMVEG